MPSLPSWDPHHQECRIELEGPFFGSANGHRSNARRFELCDRIKQSSQYLILLGSAPAFSHSSP